MAIRVGYSGPFVVTTTGSTGITITEPVGVQAGDHMFVWISHRGTIGYQAPSGWAKVLNESSGNTTEDTTGSIASGELFAIIRGSSAPVLTFAEETGTNDFAIAYCVAYRGVDDASPLIASSITTLGAADTLATTGAAMAIPSGATAVMFLAGARNAVWSNYRSNAGAPFNEIVADGGTDLAGGSIAIADFNAAASESSQLWESEASAGAQHVIAGIVLNPSSSGSPLLETLTDNFNDGIYEPTKWLIGNPYGAQSASAILDEVNGAFQVAFPDFTPSYSGLMSINTYKLTGSSMYVRLLQPLEQLTGTETPFGVHLDADNWLVFNIENGLMKAMTKVAGTVSTIYSSETYNAVDHAWFRIRETSGRIFFEVAPQSASNPPISTDWVSRIDIAAPFSVDNVKAHIGAGVWSQNLQAVGTARYDGLNTTVGAPVTSIPLVGSAFATAIASGNMTLLKAVAASVSAQASASGTLTSTPRQAIQGSTSALATATGSLTTFKRLAASVSATASATADLSVGHRFNGSAAAQASASGTLGTNNPLVASAAAQTSASATLTTRIRLAGGATITVTASATLDVGKSMSASATAVTSASGTLTTQVRLSGSAVANTFAGAYFGEAPIAPAQIAVIPAGVRCILVEVDVKSGGVETTRYLSNKPYITNGNETPAHKVYEPVVVGGVKFTESISVDSDTFNLSYGDIEVENATGSKDSWLDDIWTNRTVRVLLGDASWPRSQFIQIFEGVVAGIESKRYDRLNLRLSDKLQRLNHPVTEAKLGGVSQNKDRLLPLCFGEVHNFEPLLVNPAVQEYQVHDGAIERIIEVRDNGVPVSFTAMLDAGKFRLNQAPVGTITCSVQGDKTPNYTNNAAIIIQRIVTRFGHATRRFTGSDINQTSFGSFAASNTMPVGIYLGDKTNVLDVANRLAVSVGARLVMGRDGKLSLVRIELPRPSAGTLVGPSDMVERSLSVSKMVPVQAAVKIGYCRNYSVQEALQTGLPTDHIDLYAQEWLTETRRDSTAAFDHNLHTEPDMQETLLLRAVDAIAEADRRLNLFKVQRRVVQYTGFSNLMTQRLGDSQTVQHQRFGLSAGVAGQIVGLTSDWLAAKVQVEVLL